MRFTKRQMEGQLALEFLDHRSKRDAPESVYTDASTYAFGSTTGLWGRWNETELCWTIALKEMEAVVRQVKLLEFGTTVLIRVDNTVVFYSLSKGRSFNAELNKRVRKVGAIVTKNCLEISFEWVPSEENLADEISRRLI